MIKYLSQIVALLLLFTAALPVNAQIASTAFWDSDSIIVCPAFPDITTPPDFSSDDCTHQPAAQLDPQGKFLWIKANISIPIRTTQSPAGSPLSLYVSGKMSSEVYLNGQLIGRNGIPGIDKASETPGKMDAELFPAQDIYRLGNNEIVLRVSSHHGLIHLKRPVHMVAIAPTGILARTLLPTLTLSLITFGVFSLAGLYYAVIAIISTPRISAITLATICCFAAGQLFSETMRSLVHYDYPIHEIRLIAIALFSSAFGISITFHIFRTFKFANLKYLMAGITSLCILVLFFVPGFDFKALAGMSAPLFVGLGATGLWTYQGRPKAFIYFLSLLIFLGAILLFQALFLDTVFFLLVAIFLFVLFIEQALTLVEETRERNKLEVRTSNLEQALAAAQERQEANFINVKSAGAMERIATNEIIHCQGASGYSEITLTNGRTLLHTASLNEMENILPATFLRVHRSHLINTMFVKSLLRDTSGTGTLTLTGGSAIPVSRRIMPKVREALA